MPRCGGVVRSTLASTFASAQTSEETVIFSFDRSTTRYEFSAERAIRERDPREITQPVAVEIERGDRAVRGAKERHERLDRGYLIAHLGAHEDAPVAGHRCHALRYAP